MISRDKYPKSFLVQKGDRVIILVDHIHAGKAGSVVGFDVFTGTGLAVVVELDDGTKTAVFESCHIREFPGMKRPEK